MPLWTAGRFQPRLPEALWQPTVRSPANSGSGSELAGEQLEGCSTAMTMFGIWHLCHSAGGVVTRCDGCVGQHRAAHSYGAYWRSQVELGLV